MSLREEIHKRVMANALIQGAAIHTYMTAHYVVDKELKELGGEEFFEDVKTFVWGSMHAYFGDGQVNGLVNPNDRFWQDFTVGGQVHFYAHHPILNEFGQDLYDAGKLFVENGHKGNFSHSNLQRIYQRLVQPIHRDGEARFSEIAVEATHRIIGVPKHKLNGELTTRIPTRRGLVPGSLDQILNSVAVGCGGVEKTQEGMTVVAKAHTFPVLIQELIKGSMELLSFHGLNTLELDKYNVLRKMTDRIADEPFLIQVGAPIWRALLRCKPEDCDIATTMMGVFKLKAEAFIDLMEALITDEPWAKELISGIVDG